jgi:2-oxoglutarate dehydrogenase E2 component (dihydrolipoamide succinyltransferase)
VGADLYTVDTDASAIAATPAPPADAPTPVASAPAAPVATDSTPAAAAPAAAAPVAAKAAPAPAATAPSAPSTGGDRSETRVKMTRMRLRIAQRLKEAQGTAAMLTTFQECDMGNLIDMRNKYKEQFEKVHGVKLGFMSAFVQVSSYLFNIVLINIAVN